MGEGGIHKEEKQRERGREGDRQRGRERERERDRQTDRQTDSCCWLVGCITSQQYASVSRPSNM